MLCFRSGGLIDKSVNSKSIAQPKNMLVLAFGAVFRYRLNNCT